MSDRWTRKSLKDVVDYIADNRGRNPKAYSEKGIPVIDNYLITSDGVIDLSQVKRYIDQDTYNTFLRKYIFKDDVLVTLVGNGYGKVGITPPSKCAIVQNTIGLRCNEQNDNLFLYYLLKHNRSAMMALNQGAAQPSIKVGALLDLEFDFPPLETQQRIGQLLKSLDNKIELNRKINANLEATAQAIFKSWFVDFDPVRAKSEGREPIGMDSETAALFPSEFVDSELGKIPKGWEVTTLGTFGKSITGKTPPKKIENPYSQQGTPFITPSDVSNEIFIHTTNRYLTETGLSAVKKSLLEAGSICVTCIGSQMGKTFIAPYKSVTNQQINSLTLEDHIWQPYLLFNLRRRKDELYSLGSNGSTMPILNKSSFDRFLIVKPQHDIADKYNQQVTELMRLFLRNTIQEQSLKETRDTLLPKLLSGELSLQEAKS